MGGIRHHQEDSEVLRQLSSLRNIIQGGFQQIMLDLTKLKDQDAVLAQDVTNLGTTIQTEAVAIQNAIDNLNNLNPTDPTVQAAIDQEVASLGVVHTNLVAATTAVTGLPIAPTPTAVAAMRKPAVKK